MTDDDQNALRRQRRIFLWLVVACLASLMLVCVAVAWRVMGQRRIEQHSLQLATEEAALAATTIEQRLRNLLVVDDIAQQITQDQLTDEQVEELLARLTVENTDHFTFSVGFADADDLQHPRARSWRRTADGVLRTESHLLEDEHEEVVKWYWEPIRQNQGVWSQTPVFSEYTQDWWSGGYSVPFLRPDKNGQMQPAGVVSADFVLANLRREVYQAVRAQLSSLPPEASIGFVISKTGRIISHPDQRVVEQAQLIDAYAPSLSGVESIEQLPLMSAQHDVRYLANQPSSDFGHEQYLLFAPVGSAGWWVVVALDEQEIFHSDANIGKLHQLDIGVLLSALLLSYAVVNLLLRVDRGGLVRAWVSSMAFSALCVVAVLCLWSLQGRAGGSGEHKDILLVNDAVAAKIRLQYSLQTGTEPVAVPTGVFIQTAQFSSANNVTVTGYLWQKYSADTPEHIQPTDSSPGFVLPESEETTIELAFHRTDGEVTVWGWYFKAILRQEFDYRHYPFDSEDVWVRIWHRDFSEGVLLVPDMQAYTTIAPTDLPGIEQEDFVLEGWRVTQSFFSYRLNSYNVNFGTGTESGRTDFPELYFHVGMERRFLHPFIVNVLPLMIVALLLFAILLTARLQEQHGELRGFSTTNVLSFCAALFFVVIVSHISLRERLTAEGLIYLEYFYFVSYLSILAVSVNSLLLTSSLQPPLLHYHDNLLARILYWPVQTATLLLLTIWAFG